ncbi:MAG: hypothetical protein ACT4QB_17760 [Gammaproteobacteria bacterium]
MTCTPDLIDLSRRVDETNRRIDAVREELTARVEGAREALTHRIDETNDRLNRLYEVIVRREEHEGLAQRVTRLEQKVEDLTARLAA